MSREWNRRGLSWLLLSIVVCAALYWLAPVLGFNGAQRWTLMMLAGVGLLSAAAVAPLKERLQQLRRSRAQLREATGEGHGRVEVQLKELGDDLSRAQDHLAAQRSSAARGASTSAELPPWIAVLGPPGAGKSSTLDRSGLRLTQLGRKAGGGMGSPCTWWHCDDAVFVDMAGGLAVQEEDHALWIGLLKRLRKARPASPLSAVVVQVGVDELLQLTPRAVEVLGLQLQQRLQELMLHSGSRLPVCLVFGKMDRLEGFVETFNCLPAPQREAAWGFSVCAEALVSRTVSDLVGERFDALVESVVQLATSRAVRLTQPQERERALCFHHELRRCSDRLRLLSDVIFEERRGRERPWLTDVLFVSATQDGSTLPGLRQDLADSAGAELGLPEPPLEAAQAYFVGGMFKQVIARARGSAAMTDRAWRVARRGLFLAASLAMILSCSASFALTQRHISNRQWLIELDAAVTGLLVAPDVVTSRGVLLTAALSDELDAQERVLRLIEVSELAPLLDPSRDRAQRLLLARVDEQLIEPLSEVLHSELMAVRSEGADGDARPRDAADVSGGYLRSYAALKAGYMLSGDVCVGADVAASRRWLAGYLAGLWRQMGPEGLDTLVSGDDAARLEQAIAYFLEALPVGGADPERQLEVAPPMRAHLQLPSEDWHLVRQHLRRGDAPEDVLFRLMSQEVGGPSVTLLGAGAFGETGLSAVFTPQGCGEYFAAPQLEQVWPGCLLGFEQMADARDEASYLQAHARAWQSWLAGLSLVAPHFDLHSAVELMEMLGGSQGSALQEVLEVISGRAAGGPAQNTGTREATVTQTAERGLWSRALDVFGQGPLSGNGAAANSARALAEPRVCRLARAPFSGFADALEPGDPRSESRLAYIEALNALGARLRRLEKSTQTERERAAFELIQQAWSAAGPLAEVAVARERFVQSLGSGTVAVDATALGVLLSGLEDDIYGLLVPPAQQHLQSQWHNTRRDVLAAGFQSAAASARSSARSCQAAIDLIDSDLRAFAEASLEPLLEAGSLRTCRVASDRSPAFELSAGSCQQIGKLLSCARRAQCLDPPEAKAPEPLQVRWGEFRLADDLCEGAAALSKVWIDTGVRGEPVYECDVSQGKCRPSSRYEPRGKVAVFTQVAGESRPQVAGAFEGLEDLQALLAKGRRAGTSRWLEFAQVRLDLCPSGGLAFALPVPLAPVAAGPTGPEPDSCLGSLVLPRSILTQGGAQ